MKKSFAKLTALCLAAAVAFGAAGCGKEKKETQQDKNAVAADDTKEDKKTEKAADALQTAVMLADQAPELQAEAAILIEASSGTILYEKNATQKMYPASMTKMLTALVALDYFKPEDLIVVGSEINEVSLDSSKAGHELGETLTVENAIRGLIIPSGNDSANVVAAAVAKKAENDENMTFGKCEVVFTDLMNKKAEELGATNSHFANAHGYHSDDHYTCAHRVKKTAASPNCKKITQPSMAATPQDSDAHKRIAVPKAFCVLLAYTRPSPKSGTLKTELMKSKSPRNQTISRTFGTP